MKFLIQTYNGQITHDFSFTLIESLKYQNWYTNTNDFQYVLTDNPKPDFIDGYVPCGSVEFVLYYLQKYFWPPAPRNIPIELMGVEYTLRNVIVGTRSDITGLKFVKPADKFKSGTFIVNGERLPDAILPHSPFQISNIIDISSEWRCFIYNNNLEGLQNYSGDFTIFPNVDKIKQMIDAFAISAPVAYTLDVGVNEKGTFVIEVHDFFSCGLYGFADHRHYPFMLSKWFFQYTQKYEKPNPDGHPRVYKNILT